jgi:hypothetical protein
MSEVVRNRRVYSAPSLPSSCVQEAFARHAVGTALVEEQHRGRMPKGMGRNDRHPSALAGEFDPGVECLVAEGSAISDGKEERRSREVYSPTPKPHAPDTFQECEPSSSESDNSFVRGRSRK